MVCVAAVWVATNLHIISSSIHIYIYIYTYIHYITLHTYIHTLLLYHPVAKSTRQGTPDIFEQRVASSTQLFDPRKCLSSLRASLRQLAFAGVKHGLWALHTCLLLGDYICKKPRLLSQKMQIIHTCHISSANMISL